MKEDIVIPSNLEINPYTFVDIKLKYEFYIKIIEFFGGYLFQEHLYKFSGKSKRQVLYDMKEMKKENIIKVVSIASNNNLVMLTVSSLRYLKNKPNVSSLHFPTFTQLKTCVYLGEYLENPINFFQPKKAYSWFLEKYKNEIEKYKSSNGSADIKFLNGYRDRVKLVKSEELKVSDKADVFSMLKTARIYVDTVENGIVTLLVLDFDRTKYWIYKTLSEKVEPIFRTLGIYKGYNLKILVSTNGRKEGLTKDLKNIKKRAAAFMFLKDINIINLNINRYFQCNRYGESCLTEEDKLNIKAFKEKLKEN